MLNFDALIFFMLKKVLITLAVIIVIPLIAALFIKKDYAIERQVTINRSSPEVFDYIRHIKNQDHYSVWNLKDPGMKRQFSGTDGQVGFISAWESNNEEVGAGEQEIVHIDEGRRIDMKLRFKVPFETENDAYMSAEPLEGQQTRVIWGFKGHMPYPFNLMSLFFDMDEAVGSDLEGGLANLRKLLESQQPRMAEATEAPAAL